ncbi:MULTISPECIES: efflux RND transporter periplasmic adaptor subunit [Gammaproteobacteria]|uniref:efflux RND transporter periplasmic adaptor subunit n=1 Tax=Gammaproteobacteria TaxID=1236 RepID=UPI000DCF6BF6|nr:MULTISPECIES: efflux RND transporter periplasmic adaptor subunit [Gammaproteobacteria]RTE85583.1 efflux RND transporter periplasmic adaptor subunit [Aliidiomarina sp. B3213]TCZ89553.1 efflux RND transporter periplasmic adaptor subunit [Lysobacter sp. N42]
MRIAVVALLTIFIAFAPSSHAQQWGGSRAAQVVASTITFDARTQRVEAVGNTEAINSVVIYPAVGDLVTNVHFGTGQRVEQGDVLVELDSRRQRTDLARAEIELADAQRTVERLAASRERGAIPQSELDDAITARDLAEVRKREAETNLEDRFVRAPFDGVVGLTDIEVGDRISTSTVITTIDSRERLFVNFQAPETALNMLQTEDTVTATPWQNSTQALTLRIADIDSRVDAQSRTIRVRAILDNEEDKYRPGMSFRVNLEVEGEFYAVVPEAALMWGAEGAYVWRVNDDKAERVNVEIQQRRRGEILVESALTAQDIIVVEGVQTLRPGQALSVSMQGE